MYKTYVVDCQCLIAFLQDNVPKHMSSNTLSTNLTRRISIRLLKEAIFNTLPKESMLTQLNMMDYRLLNNLFPEDLDRLMDLTMDNLKSIFYNKQIDLANYAYISCTFDGTFLYIRAGVEKCTTKCSPLQSMDCNEI